jgi:hypothetical protein
MRKSIVSLFIIIRLVSADGYQAEISPISPEIKQRMLDGNSWRKGCPVGPDDLRYLQIHHIDFDGKNRKGELIVHKDVAQNVVRVFEELYNIGYPIRQMKLISDYKGSDWDSIEADNTSAFNCRPVTGNKKKWSSHAYGKAIDINPIENPYIFKSGHISHKASLKYKKRLHIPSRGLPDKALLLKNDKATKIFETYGWKWGGDWKYAKDYQHFVYAK